MISKIIANTESINLTMLNPSDESPKRGLPYAVVLMIICIKEKKPPPKSNKTFSKLHPTVDFLLKFKYTWGIYLMRVIAALQYPHILMVEKF